MWELRTDKKTGKRIVFNCASGKPVAILTDETTDEEAHRLAAAQVTYFACVKLSNDVRDEYLEYALAQARGQHLLAQMLVPVGS